MFKRIVFILIVLCFIFVSNGFAGGVTDNNNGNKGYILVSTGKNNGANSVGHWTDSSFLKGDTGQDGVDGQDGYTPIKGVDYFDGVDGLNGTNGKDGLNGVDGERGKRGKQGLKGDTGQDGLNGVDGTNGKDGVNGIDGVKGDTGEQGITGQNGVDGQDGKTPIKGKDYDDGKDGVDGKTPIKNIDYFDGVNGKNGKDVDPSTVNKLNNKIDNNSNRINKLEESQYIVGGVLRIKSTKKWDVDLFADYSTNRQMVDRSGIRFTYKFGESYTDKKINELEQRITNMENN